MAHRLSRLLLLTVVLFPSLAPGIKSLTSAPELQTVGDGSLESCTEAALDAALAGGGDIAFLCGGAHTITVTSQKVIQTATTIDGDDLVTISGGDAVSIFKVEAGAELTLKELVLTNGRGALFGGAIESFGTVVLRNSTVQNSTLPDDCLDCFGAGIASRAGRLEVYDTHIIGNTGGSGGGGIANADVAQDDSFLPGADLVIRNSVIQGNRTTGAGGGIMLMGIGEISNTVISDNEAVQSFGGGIATFTGTLALRNSVVERNRAGRFGGGILISTTVEPVHTEVTISDTRISENSTSTGENLGGGVFITGGAILALARSTVSNNTAGGGAGLFGEDAATQVGLEQSTFSGNTAMGDGGALWISSGLHALTNVTLSGNTAGRGGGIFVGPNADRNIGVGTGTLNHVTLAGNRATEGASIFHDTGSLRLQNTIVADPLDESPNCVFASATSALESGGYNLVDDDSCAIDNDGDLRGIDPLLGPLTENGGPTLTHLPTALSPAIDAGGATCPDVDQRGYTRPASAGCDIGAVELGAQGPIPTPPEPTPTTEPEPTPTAMPLGEPAPELIPADLPAGVKPSIVMAPTHGYLGQEFTVSGVVPEGYGHVRLSVVVDGQTIGNTLADVDASRTYSERIRVDEQFTIGEAQVCAIVTGEDTAENACTPFVVDPAPTSVVRGTIPVVPGAPPRGQFRLMDAAGAALYTTGIGTDGVFQVDDVKAATYQYAFTGDLGREAPEYFEGGQVTVTPGRRIDVAAGALRSCLHSIREKPASASVEAAPSRHAVERAYVPFGVGQGFTIRNQVRPFGIYVSGIQTMVTFTAFPQVSGSIDKVIFELKDRRGNLIRKLEPSRPPYTATFDVGQLPPSLRDQHAELVVTPIVSGSRQCASFFPIEVMPNPIDRDANPFVQPGSTLRWDAIGGVYRFNVLLPYIEGVLPTEFSFDLGSFVGTVDNRFNAAVQVKGFFNLEGKGRFEQLAVIAEAKVLDQGLFGPDAILNIPTPLVEFNLNTMREIGIPYGPLELVPLIGFELAFIKIPVFTFFGIITVSVNVGAGVNASVYITGAVKPLKPEVLSTITSYGDLYADIGVSSDLFIFIATAGVGQRTGVRVKLPLDIEARPDGVAVGFDDPCVELYAAVKAWTTVLFGLYKKTVIKELYNTGACAGRVLAAREPTQIFTDDLEVPELIAAPALAIAPDGTALSAYVADTALEGEPARIQILASFTNPESGEAGPPVPLSNAAHDARSPVVAFAGPNATPLVAWVENTLTYEEAQALADDELSTALRRQEIFYSLWTGEAWGAPVQLTTNEVPEGLPAIAGSSAGAVLAWTRDTDGDLGTHDDIRTAVALFDPEQQQFGPVELLGTPDGGINADVDVAYDLRGAKPIPYVVWVNDIDADVVTAGDRRIALAYAPETDWVLLNPQPLPPRVDSPAITGGPEGMRLAFLVREQTVAGEEPELIGTNGALWTARLTGDDWTAEAVLNEAGAAVYAERPELDSYGNETLLTFREFGEIGTNAELGQISLSRIVADEQPSAPLLLTDEPNQNWYQSVAIDPRNGQAQILKVAATYLTAPRGSRSLSVPAAGPQVQVIPGAVLSATEDGRVEGLMVKLGADPALDPLVVTPAAPAPGALVTVRATVRNVGRGRLTGMTLRLYTGTPGSGTLLRTVTVPGSLEFNQAHTLSIRVPGQAGTYSLYAEVTAGANANTANDRATITLGQLSAPGTGTIGESATYIGAFQLVWPANSDEYITGYRLLRGTSPGGAYELVGETSQPIFTDTIVDRRKQYCYKVQAYNAAGVFSPLSEPWCGMLTMETAPGTLIFLPLVSR